MTTDYTLLDVVSSFGVVLLSTACLILGWYTFYKNSQRDGFLLGAFVSAALFIGNTAVKFWVSFVKALFQ